MAVKDTHDRRQARQRARGRDDPRGRARGRHRDPDPLPPRRDLPTSAPAGSAWSRSGERGRLQPACVTKVAEEMVVQTDTERLRHYRRMIVELLFAERNHVCSVCVANGNCELQDLAIAVGMDHVALRLPEPGLRGRPEP